MSSAAELAARIKEEQRMEVKVSHMTFICIRPTWEQTLDSYRKEETDYQIARKFLIGWSGVKESDLLPGAEEKEIPYNKQLFDLASGNMEEVVQAISQQVITASTEYKKKEEAAAKN